MPLDIRIRFGRAIRRIGAEQQINQEEAADRCGLHRTYYSGIERGVRNVSLVPWLYDLVIANGRTRAWTLARQPVWRPALHSSDYIITRSWY
jgi:hypothetical protein